MSYGREIPCYDCPEKFRCTDGDIMNAAIDLIHVTAGKSHKGYGNIKLLCSAKENHLKQQEQK